MSRLRWVLLALILVLPRIVLSTSIEPISTRDSVGYLEAAQALREHRPDPMLVLRVPGYPALIALASTLSSDVSWAIVCIQHLLGLLTGLLLFDTARRLFGVATAAAALALYACDVRFWVYEHQVLADAPVAFLILASTWSLILFLQNGRRWALWLSALLTGLATITKPVAMLQFAISSVHLPGPNRLRTIGIYATVALILPASWVARNTILHDFPSLSPTGATGLLQQVLPGLDFDAPPKRELKERLRALILQNGSEIVVDKLYQDLLNEGRSVASLRGPIHRLIREALVHDPKPYLTSRFRSLGGMLGTGGPNVGLAWRGPSDPPSYAIPPWTGTGLISGSPRTTTERMSALYRQLASIGGAGLIYHALLLPPVTWILMTLVVVGIRTLHLDRRLTRTTLLVIAVIAYHWAVPILGHFGSERFRLASEPLLLILAACGLPGNRSRTYLETAPPSDGQQFSIE